MESSERQQDGGENDTKPSPSSHQPQNPPLKKRSFPSPHEVIGEHTASLESSAAEQHAKGGVQSDNYADKDTKPSAKRPKAEVGIPGAGGTFNHNATDWGHGGETPPASSQQSLRDLIYTVPTKQDTSKDAFSTDSMGKTPVSHVRRSQSSGSVSSDISSSSASTARNDVLSPIPPSFVSEVPPAPPSTPASTTSISLWDFGGNMPPSGLMTPLPVQPAVLNATKLEQQQLLAEGAATPAPHRAAGSTSSDNGDDAPPHTLLSDDFSDWAVGDRYEMVRVLGRGSYGEVAQAIDLREGRPDAFVAIKRIQSPFDQEVDAIRLYREMHILRQMRGHECIIQLIDVVQPPTDDLDDFHDLYLVFEYVDTDLYKLILSPQYLTTQHIQTFLYQMLAGLKYIHSFSVIHRDLKPANILLNEDCSLKICDFGLARIVSETLMSSGEKRPADATDHGDKPAINSFALPPKTGLTRQLTKHVVTRWYRAPELILIQPYTSAVDIWSLGCILAELLSMQEGNVAGYEDRKALFPGGTCFPLSGEGKLTSDDKLDQLSVIFDVIGTPSAEDIAAVGNANEYIKSLRTSPGKPFEQVFPAADKAALDLLKRMLQFNPKRRLTAAQALEHDFFRGVRQERLERAGSGPLQAPEFLETNRVNLRELKRKIYEEVLCYRDSDGEMDSKPRALPLAAAG